MTINPGVLEVYSRGSVLKNYDLQLVVPPVGTSTNLFHKSQKRKREQDEKTQQITTGDCIVSMSKVYSFC